MFPWISLASSNTLLISSKIPFSKPTAATVPKVFLVIFSTLFPVLIDSLVISPIALSPNLKLSFNKADWTNNSSPKRPKS